MGTIRLRQLDGSYSECEKETRTSRGQKKDNWTYHQVHILHISSGSVITTVCYLKESVRGRFLYTRPVQNNASYWNFLCPEQLKMLTRFGPNHPCRCSGVFPILIASTVTHRYVEPLSRPAPSSSTSHANHLMCQPGATLTRPGENKGTGVSYSCNSYTRN